MTTSSRTRSNAPLLPMSSGLQRSSSPQYRFYSSPFSASSFAPPCSSSSSKFNAQSSSTLFSPPASPTSVNLLGFSLVDQSVRFSLESCTSPSHHVSVITVREPSISSQLSAHSHRKTCMCSPTTHPGSFRCSLHKGQRHHSAAAVPSPSSRLNARRSAMTNSLVRISTVEGDLVKRALSALIRPSSQKQRRRVDFHPRPSRLSRMSKADDL